MGHTTDFVGHIDLTPPLNGAEQTYLTAFSRSRRWDRPEGPYAVPGNPYADEVPGGYDDRSDHDRYNRPAPGQPQLWCQWVPCGAGGLTFDGHEKFYRPVAWMGYLIDHFLRPGAAASAVGDPQFDRFGFDHHLDGIVVGCRRDTRELFTVEVRDNEVTSTVLRRGDPQPWEEPMPYEVAADREARRRPRRRNRNLVEAGVSSEVVDLASRRPRG